MTTCFLVLPTGVDRRWLRRYTESAPNLCPLMPGEHSYHQAGVEIERAAVIVNADGYHETFEAERSDPRWPVRCRCGFEFTAEVGFQTFAVEVYRRADTGEEMTIRDKRPGMMWFSPWYYDPTGKLNTRRENGNAFLSIHYWRDWAEKRAPLSVLGPDGNEWCVDRGSSNGDGWTVIGEAPSITCAPSIVLPGYHGFLRGGVFTADLDAGRQPIAPKAWSFD